MRILIAEDDPKVARSVRTGLVREGFAVDAAVDGREAFLRALDENYDLIVLDLLLPYVSGLELISRLRKEGSKVPILVLSAKASVAERVEGLRAGADDYLVKPFAFPELAARVHALLRRPSNLQPSRLQIGSLEVDFAAHAVKYNGNQVRLTRKEFALLEYLMRNQGTVVTRAMIAEHVWDQHFDSFSNSIDVYVRYLRNKLQSQGAPALIHTVRGVGYVFSLEAP